MATGTLHLTDLLEVKNQSIIEYGLEPLTQAVQLDVRAHNQLIDEALMEIAVESPEPLRSYAGDAQGEMREVDEYATSRTQKHQRGDTVGFPLRKYDYVLGWTREWALQNTPADMAIQILNAQKADRAKLLALIKIAVFRPTNETFVEVWGKNNGIEITVKRLLNADSSLIPSGPFGEAFDGATHSHYLAEATLSNAGALSLVSTIVEHGHGNEVRIYINHANETAWRALTDFVDLPDPRLIYRSADLPGMTLDLSVMTNRRIGLFGAAEVWTKPWVPAGYAFAFDAMGPKPLQHRVHAIPAVRGFRMAFQHEDYPLYTEGFERYAGFGVWQRTNGAVLQFTNGTYQDPTA